MDFRRFLEKENFFVPQAGFLCTSVVRMTLGFHESEMSAGWTVSVSQHNSVIKTMTTVCCILDGLYLVELCTMLGTGSHSLESFKAGRIWRLFDPKIVFEHQPPSWISCDPLGILWSCEQILLTLVAHFKLVLESLGVLLAQSLLEVYTCDFLDIILPLLNTNKVFSRKNQVIRCHILSEQSFDQKTTKTHQYIFQLHPNKEHHAPHRNISDVKQFTVETVFGTELRKAKIPTGSLPECQLKTSTTC